MSGTNGPDEVLFGYIVTKQWKQALKACEKKLKLTPGSEYLLAVKILILVQWPERFEQGLREFKALSERKPPAADIEALRTLDIVISCVESRLAVGPKQRQTWQRAAASRPQDLKLHETWYWIKFDDLDYRGAQQASMTWMKNFPNERKPFFLYILNTHLVAQQTVDMQERGLMQTLAYRTISKAAADAQNLNRSASSAGREIDSFEDLSLLLRVYQADKRYAEAVELLHDPHIGFTKYVGGQRWELLTRYMELLGLQQRWGDLRVVCLTILKETRHHSTGNTQFGVGKFGDDWKTWQTLISANFEDNCTENSPAVEDMILSFCGTSGNTAERNARMAQLVFYAKEVFDGRKSQDVLLTALTKYFESFSTKSIFFSDVKEWISYLDFRRQKQLLLDATKICKDISPRFRGSESGMIYWITSEINVLKLEYNLVISQHRNSQNIDLLTAFIRNCLRLYKESLEFGFDLPVCDRRPGDDAALLAAMGLVRLFKLGRKHALLQCIVVLEHTLLQSKHNYDALLILVRLYVFLGAGSLAMERYSTLSIKNIQYATVPWVLYTRLSSIHPYPVTYSDNGKRQLTIDPLEDIVQASKWHTSAEIVSMRAVHKMQANSQWNMSLDTLETNQAVVNGFSKFLMVVEGRRIARIRSSPYDSSTEPINLPSQTDDYRDREAFPSFEGDGLSFEGHLPTAGTSVEPDDAWLRQQISLASFWDVLHNNGEDRVVNRQTEVAPQPESCTDQEQALYYMVNALSALHTLYSGVGDRYEKETDRYFIEEFLDTIEEWVAQCRKKLASKGASMILGPNFNVPPWSLFHDLFTHLEMCKFVIPTVEFAARENKKQSLVGQVWLTDRVEAIRQECTKLADTVLRSANRLRDKVRDQATLQQFEEVVLGGSNGTHGQDVIADELKNLGDYMEVRQMCQDITESWIDGLDGVIRTKIA